MTRKRVDSIRHKAEKRANINALLANRALIVNNARLARLPQQAVGGRAPA